MIGPSVSSMQSLQNQASQLLQKGELGLLTLKDVREIDQIVSTLQSQISNMETTGSGQLPSSTSLEGLDPELLTKIAIVKEKNLAIQRDNFTKAVENGVVSFQQLEGNALSFEEKMNILMERAPRNLEQGIEITFTNVPDKKGVGTGVLKMIIKPGSLFDESKQLLSQIKDPLYRDELLSNAEKNHYSFEFFDLGRQGEIDRKLQELDNQQKALDDLTTPLNKFMSDLDEEAFNRSFTLAQRALFGIDQNQQLEENEIYALYEQYQDKLMMHPIEVESIKTEFAKATISGRFSEDGSIGELKSVNIHSPGLGGKELMDFWDKFCGYMEPTQVYLEDDAKIEGEKGSYNLRLFRLMGLPDKASWYTDGYQYHSYQPEEQGVGVMTDYSSRERQFHAATPFKEMTLATAKELLQKDGMKPNSETLKLLNRYIENDAFGGDTKMGSLVKNLGDKVRTGEPLHKELDTLLGAISDFSKYEGQDGQLNDLKQNALVLTSSRFYRKSYS